MAHVLPVRRRTRATDPNPARAARPAVLDRSAVPPIVLLGIALILLSVAVEAVIPDIRNANLNLFVGVVDSCIAAFAAVLAQGRYARSFRLQDAALAVGLRLIAVSGFLDSLLRVLDVVLPLVPLVLRTLGALGIVFAGIAPTTSFLRRARPAAVAFAAPLIGIPAAVATAITSPLMPLDPDHDDAPIERLVMGADYIRPVDATIGILLVVAATGFLLRWQVSKDRFLGSLGLAFALGAAARFDFALYPELHLDSFSAGDVLRTACYVVILLGASREAREYWHARAEVALLEDRRRIARELHDGVVQELALMRLEAKTLGDATGERIAAAADRALDESRSAVHALTAEGDDRLDAVLRETMTEMARRYGFELRLAVEPMPAHSADERHTVLRIAREAVGNAVRNGHARTVHVTLRGDGDGRLLDVVDDGLGFDLERVERGHGLRSMRERAAALGGTCLIDSAPGRGTRVRTAW